MDSPTDPADRGLAPSPSRLRSLADALEADGWSDLARDVRQAVVALEAEMIQTQEAKPAPPPAQ
jgi:hypothetical protein